MTEGALEFVGTGTRLEGLLQLVLLHFCADANHGPIDLRPGVILTWAGEHGGLANAEVGALACSNDMSEVLIVNGRLVGLVLARAWHVEVLVCASANLDAHVELRFLFRILKLPLELVGGRRGTEHVRGLNIITIGTAYARENIILVFCFMLFLLQIWVERMLRVVALRAYRLGSLVRI